ncbi:hypothetical protein ABIE89_007228 [Bradyrhizobium niftali]
MSDVRFQPVAVFGRTFSQRKIGFRCTKARQREKRVNFAKTVLSGHPHSAAYVLLPALLSRSEGIFGEERSELLQARNSMYLRFCCRR